MVLQIISLDTQSREANSNVSYVSIGNCEKILKSVYNIPESESLIMSKSDYKTEDKYKTSILFNLYHPITKEKLNMSYCEKINMQIDIPTNLENKTQNIYNSLDESGYNLFDSEDDFYNDECSTYTSEDGTDMILSDRQNLIYSQYGNISFCQSGCTFKSYNKNLKTVQCDCDVKSISSETDTDELFNTEELKKSFVNTILNSNFIVLRCIKLAFTFTKNFTNKGRIIMSIFIFGFIGVFLIFYFKDRKSIHKFYKIILNKNNNTHINKSVNSEINGKIDEINIYKKKSDKNNSKKKSIIGENSNNDILIKNQKSNPTKKNAKRNTYIGNFKYNFNSISQMIKEQKKEDESKISESEIEEKEKEKIEKFIDTKNMTDRELNSLEYEDALKYDKRTFWQYYWTLLKQNQLILFTFLPSNDYNLVSLKIILFIMVLSVKVTINGFFFTDKTMHNIVERKGKFDIVYQIPQIIYSSLISIVIKIILQKLALTENIFLDLKKEKNLEKIKKEYKDAKKTLFIRFILFFIISFIVGLFCWYFVTCFCAVYINTQNILLKDTLISFLISMIYPFGSCLLPALFRFTALQDKNKDKKYMYQFSRVIEIL